MKPTRYLLIPCLLLATALSPAVHAQGGEPAEPDPGTSDPVDTGGESIEHSLDFDSDPLARRIEWGSKSFGEQSDQVFRDGLGREVVMRGFNVSGKVKLADSGFKPFKNTADADASFSALGKQVGANLVRFTVAWEGIHTAPDTIDYAYLDAVVAQMKEAISRRMYIVVDWHSDLYSRHTFTEQSDTTGNGAPGWIVEPGNHGTDDCGLPCDLTWSAHKQSDSAVRSAMRDFWLNADIETQAGTRQVQSEFLWHLGETAAYIQQELSADELDYLLGFEPFNEPFDGGLDELGVADYDAFDNDILWPFYERVRDELDSHGLNDKWVYAEPMVFWSSLVDVIAPATGGGYLDYKPGDGFVFAPHFYDQGRMGINNFSVARNGTYFENIDKIRDEARFLELPIFLGEFGMWLEGHGHTDTERVVNATYQAMELSDRNTGKDRFADFYVPTVTGTQWQWDYYYDNHYEFQNGNPDELRTEDDAWNGENFSVIRDYATGYNVDPKLVERVFPRRTQGDLMQFYYSAKVHDRAGERLDWGSLRLSLDGVFADREYFRDLPFALAVWRGRNADAPTELFIPRHMPAENLLVLTERTIKNKTLSVQSEPADIANEVLLTNDPDRGTGGGHRLLVWDDSDTGETDESVHFALVVHGEHGLSTAELGELQDALVATLSDHKSPVYLPGRMTHGGYPSDQGANSGFSLVDQRAGKCLDVAGANTGNGTNVQLYQCNGSNAQRWFYNLTSGELSSALNGGKCLDIDGGNISEGTNLQLWDCHGGSAQQFEFDGNRLKPSADNSLAVDAFGTGNSTNVGLWNDNGQSNQQWLRQY
ncbi:MAG: ricin-type beta-trefoil lectin domain protein [Pseudomonadota bacterium]